MKRLYDNLIATWQELAPRLLPFADAGTTELPMSRLLRLSVFQVSVGMAVVLLIGTLNRVMIVELGVPAWLVGAMVALPLVFAPLRALIGHNSDIHRSALGWRRIPYLWMGTMLQFGGLAIMPFALILLSGDTTGPAWIGDVAAALAFLLVGAGIHTTQTVGLALATDLAPERVRPRVVAFQCTMLLIGMMVSALVFALLLAPFSQVRLIQVVQGAAVTMVALNLFAMWKQEPRDRNRAAQREPERSFPQAWAKHRALPQTMRRLAATAIGTAGFGMQDILLEPFGGQVLSLTVAWTTAATALMAASGIAGLAYAARELGRGVDAYRMSAYGVVVGLAAFSLLIFSSALVSPVTFMLGVAMIGLGGGMFAHGTLTAAMSATGADDAGFALGVWGAVQATAAGSAMALGGIIRDVIAALADGGGLGSALVGPATGYSAVYHIELGLLVASLVVIGPLVRPTAGSRSHSLSVDEIANVNLPTLKG